MSNLLSITKATFLTGFNVNRKEGNQKSTFRNLIILGLIFFVISIIYNGLIFYSLEDMGMTSDDHLLLVLMFGTMLTFMISTFQMEGTLFKTRDFEFLESLPLRKSTIIAAKILSVYLMNLFEDAIIVLPAILLHLINLQDYYQCLLTFLAMFFVSFLPLVLSTLLAALIAFITSKMKHKNLFTIILYILFFSVVLCFSFLISFSTGSGTLGNIISYMNILPYYKLLYASFDPSEFYLFLIFILIHIASFLLIVLLVSLLYRPINCAILNSNTHEKYKHTDTPDLSIAKMLEWKERQSLFKDPKYLVNSSISFLIFLICSVFMLLMGRISDLGFETAEELAEYQSIMSSTVVGFSLLMCSMMTSTCASISIEGNCFESLLSYPISEMQIIKAKLKTGIVIPLILNGFASVVLIIIMLVIGVYNPIILLEILLFPIYTGITVAYVGMFCGLRWPKLHFENEMQLFKNSACINLTMLFSALPAAILMIVSMVFNILGEMTDSLLLHIIGFVAISAIYITAILILRKQLNKHGKDLFLKVSSR